MWQIVPVCSLFSSNSSLLCTKCITLSLPCYRDRLAWKGSRSLKFRGRWGFLAALRPLCFPTHNQYETGSEVPRVPRLLNLKSQTNPRVLYFYFVTGALVQFLEWTLCCWHEILHCKAKLALTSCRSPRVYMCALVRVCVWVCVSLPSCDCSHEYGGAPGFVQSLTRSIKPQMRASEWQRRRCRDRLDSNPEPALYLLRPRRLQVDVKWCSPGGGRSNWGVWAPIIWITPQRKPTENCEFHWIHFTVQIQFTIICLQCFCGKYKKCNTSQIFPEGQPSDVFFWRRSAWLFNVGCYYSAHYFPLPFLDRCSAFPQPNVNWLAGSLLAERSPPSVCVEPVTARMPRSGFRLRTCAVLLPATLHCLWDCGSHRFLGWFSQLSLVVRFLFFFLPEVTSESIVFMSLWYTRL